MAVALFLDKNIYCSYICPFGAAQEFLIKLKTKKIKISKNMVLLLKFIQKVVVIIFAISIVLNIDIKLSELEPFTIFLYKSVSITVLIMASLILAASAFIPKPWCAFLCPTGYAIRFFQKSHLRKVRNNISKLILKLKNK